MSAEKIKIIVVGVVALAIGFFGGMEYKAYQVRSAVNDAFSGIFDEEETEETSEVVKKEEKPPKVSNDLTQKIGFEITDKSFVEGNFQDSNNFTFQFTNNSNKDIEGIKGVITLQDLFGDQIKRVNLSYDEGVVIGESKLYRASLDYNQFMDDDIKLRNTDLAKMKYEWEVTTIIYSDGTQESY